MTEVSFERLSDTHRQCLRRLVLLRRDGKIGEEFSVQARLADITIYLLPEGKEVFPISRTGVALLKEEGLIYYAELPISGIATFVITPAGFRAVDSDFQPLRNIQITRVPVGISESLANLQKEFPDANKIAFLMMQFGKTSAHTKIHAAVQEALQSHGMVALRADEKEYHEDLFDNVLTYIYGARFGIAIFERLENDDFNPNVSLEVGYMMGLGKPVCLLKDQTQKNLNTDLVGKLYKEFDPQDPIGTIPSQLNKWMRDKGFIG